MKIKNDRGKPTTSFRRFFIRFTHQWLYNGMFSKCSMSTSENTINQKKIKRQDIEIKDRHQTENGILFVIWF